MGASELFAAERERSINATALTPVPAEEPPSFWQGSLKATGLGIMSGGARAGQAIGMAGSAIPIAIDAIAGRDNLSGTSLTDRYFDTVADATQRAVDYWSLPSGAVGTAGQILHGVAGMALPLMATAGNPALLMGSSGFGTAMDLTKQGVSAVPAVAAGITSAATTGIVMKLPMAGKTIAQSLGLGVGGNVALGVLDRATIHAILHYADYDKIGLQYKAFDPEQMAVGAAMGVVFGAIAHATKPKGEAAPKPEAEPKLTPDEHAAALTMNEVRTRDADTLAKPGDIVAMNAAHDAQAVAAAQLDRGEPVSVAHTLALDPDAVAAVRKDVGERAAAALAERIKAELLGTAGERAEPGAIPNARAELEVLTQRIEALDESFKERAKALQGEGMSRKQAESQARKDIETERATLNASADRLDQFIERNTAATHAEQLLAQLQRGEIPPELAPRIQEAMLQAESGIVERPITSAIRSAFAPSARAQAARAGKPEPRPTAEQPKPEPAAPAKAGEPAKTAAAPEITAAADMLARNPDMIVRTADGRDVRAADFMREMDAEFSRDTADASAFEAAANCSLQTGSAP